MGPLTVGGGASAGGGTAGGGSSGGGPSGLRPFLPLLRASQGGGAPSLQCC
jgi:hypothetical protein